MSLNGRAIYDIKKTFFIMIFFGAHCPNKFLHKNSSFTIILMHMSFMDNFVSAFFDILFLREIFICNFFLQSLVYFEHFLECGGKHAPFQLASIG